jgi:hypothetical protein
MKEITIKNTNEFALSILVDLIPDTCPICHTSIIPRIITTDIGMTDCVGVQIVFQCVKNGCERMFVATYERIEGERRIYYGLIGLSPRTAQEVHCSEVIENTSPSFVEILNQVAEAEAMNLTQLIGMGLRKGLEFLVKDYAVSQNPDSVDEIQKKPLGQCISDHIDNVNVKDCAKRAVWLGNDETHYTRKWIDKDIDDLRILIRLTMNWIETDLLTKKYMESMQE